MKAYADDADLMHRKRPVSGPRRQQIGDAVAAQHGDFTLVKPPQAVRVQPGEPFHEGIELAARFGTSSVASGGDEQDVGVGSQDGVDEGREVGRRPGGRDVVLAVDDLEVPLLVDLVVANIADSSGIVVTGGEATFLVRYFAQGTELYGSGALTVSGTGGVTATSAAASSPSPVVAPYLDMGNDEPANLYAAMPSLHCAWALWCGLLIARHAADRHEQNAPHSDAVMHRRERVPEFVQHDR